MSLRVVIVEDFAAFRDIFRKILGELPSVEVIGAGNSGEDVERLAEAHRPDVLLLNVGLPQKSGTQRGPNNQFRAVATITRLKKEYPEMHVLLVSAQAGSLVQYALEAGAAGYILKSDPLTTCLRDALEAIRQGRVYLSPTVAEEARTHGWGL